CHRVDLVCKVEDWKEEPHKSRDIVDEDEPDASSPSSATPRPELSRSYSYINKTLEEEQLRDLSEKIGAEWEKVATFLGLSPMDVYKIKFSYIVAGDRVFEALVQWKRGMTKNTNMVKTLAKALEDSGRRDLAEEIREMGGYNEEKRKQDIKRDLLELYNLPPFLGEILKGYEKIENPTIPFDLFMELCIALDPPDVLGNDWRRLADRLELSRFISYLESEYKEGPTSGVLWCWMKKNKSLEELAKTLDEMDRGDVALKINAHLGIEPCEDDVQGNE
ncbi:uncharacterized protein, partial [Amphiura filiformis]|uniref:uncharacterized protein n=1 Tax=Amphiura filiformis TaxID=82378 RepID=UPI003B21E4D5